MKRLVVVFLVLLLFVVLGACFTNGAEEKAGGMIAAQSSKTRDIKANVSEATMKELVDGNNEFAIKLFMALNSDGKENLFLSPYSISAALAMTYAGARGDTEKSMAATLAFRLGGKDLHKAFNALDLMLASRGYNPQDPDARTFQLNVANALWGQEDFSFKREFLDLLAVNYGAGMNLMDFKKQAEQARITINKWIEAQTQDKIKDLIPGGALNVDTRLVLTNAIYFNANWEEAFNKNQTKKENFHALGGEDVEVDMMHRTENGNFYQGDGFKALELPYRGREVSMVMLLPDQGSFKDFLSRLDVGLLNETIQNLEDVSVVTAVPKFKLESSFSMKGVLQGLGMGLAFSDAADFSGMTDSEGLAISEVVHKAFVDVDEEGTEAAAATAVVMRQASMPPMPVNQVEFIADRPFVFLIRDRGTNTILFLGQVVNPER